MEASSAQYIWDYHTPIQIAPKPTKALYTAFVHLQWPLENPVLKVEFCRSSGVRIHYYSGTSLKGLSVLRTQYKKTSLLRTSFAVPMVPR